MKLYLSASLLNQLLTSKAKKELGKELESHLQDGHRYYTSVYTLLSLLPLLPRKSSEKWRTIFHLIDELVDEIFPLEKTILEIACEKEEATLLSNEVAIAKLSGMDEVMICEDILDESSQNLPLRNFFRKAD